MYGRSSYGEGGSGNYSIAPINCRAFYSCGEKQGFSYSGGFSYGNSSSEPYGSSWNADLKFYAHNSIDSIVAHSSIEKPLGSFNAYIPKSARGTYLAFNTPQYFTAERFLIPGSTARFVGNAAEIEEYIMEAFKATTGEELPNDIIITVLNEKELKKAHKAYFGKWHPGVQGFSLNANGKGTSEVFAKADQLDRLMLTIGHEIGHVLTHTLKNAHDEEAKAFAFSLAWMNAIRKNNIAGIGSNILPNPASNGLHNIAFDFVQRIIKAGTTAWETFLQLAKGMLTITEQPIMIQEE
ncbi:MAG: hypothetical protein QXR48_01255 [Candidatus Woesearchaeota archaeon]